MMKTKSQIVAENHAWQKKLKLCRAHNYLLRVTRRLERESGKALTPEQRNQAHREGTQLFLRTQCGDKAIKKARAIRIKRNRKRSRKRKKKGPGKPSPKKKTPVLKDGPTPAATGRSQRKARVLYDYKAQADDELTVEEGNVVGVVREDDDWATCTLNGKTGSVPLNYIEYTENEDTKEAKKAPAAPTNHEHHVRQKQAGEELRKARALYDYEAQADDELTIEEGDVLGVVEEGGGWATVTLNGKTGAVPLNYIEFTENEETKEAKKAPAPAPPGDDLALAEALLTGSDGNRSNTKARSGKALYDYEAQADDELTVKEGDALEILDDDGEWATARLGGKTGSVPLNYVEIVGAK